MLTTASQIRLLGNIPDDADEEQISAYAGEAERRVKAMIGATLYAAVETDSFYADDKVKLAKAEAFLALSELLPVLNIRVNPNEGGIVSSVGFAESKNSLLSQKEVQALADSFEQKANDIIAEYVDVDDDYEDEIGGDDGFGYFSI